MNPFYLTYYESNGNCTISKYGEKLSVYWLIPTKNCTKLAKSHHSDQIGQFYIFKSDGKSVRFGCYDEKCRRCTNVLEIRKSDSCTKLEGNRSFQITVSQPDIKKQVMETNATSSIQLFYNDYHTCYKTDENIRPENSKLISTTVHFGINNSVCISTGSRGYFYVEKLQRDISIF